MPKKVAKRPIHLPSLATRKRKTYRKNPEGLIANAKDAVLSNGIVHATGGYAASRLAGRVLRRILGAKYPVMSKHATPLGNLLMAIAIYMTVKKWKKVREEAMIGAAIAVVQSLLQTYMPGLAATFLDSDGLLETPKPVAPPSTSWGLGDAPPPRPTRKFVLPGELEAGRAEAAMSAPRGSVKYVMPGSPGSGYGAPAVGDEFEDATSDVPDTAEDLGGDDDLGIFNQ